MSEHQFDGRGGHTPNCGGCRIEQLEAALEAKDTLLKQLAGALEATLQREDSLRETVKRLVGLLRRRQMKGHYDTCSYALDQQYDCDCGFAEAVALLAEHDKERA